MNRPMIAIVGVTASGKTDLAIKLAQEFDGEIICADSRTLYRGMDIVTAKPSSKERALVQHHLLDVADPDEHVSVAEFQRLAYAAMNDVWSRGRLPLMVGGSGLYVDSVLYDYQFSGPVDKTLRVQLEVLDDDKLLERLSDVDLDAYETVDRANRRRVIRAIERAARPVSKSAGLRPNTLVLGLDLDNETLRARIEARVKLMLKAGLTSEVRAMAERYGWESEAMTGIGYRAYRGVVEGWKSADDGVADFVRGDMMLVKKQRTWFRRNHDIHWLDSPDEAAGLVRRFLAGNV